MLLSDVPNVNNKKNHPELGKELIFLAWSSSGKHSHAWTECVHAQSCPTLFNPVDCSLPGSSVHGISQARILEQVSISFSRGSSQWLGDGTRVSGTGRRILHRWEVVRNVGSGLGPIGSLFCHFSAVWDFLKVQFPNLLEKKSSAGKLFPARNQR